MAHPDKSKNAQSPAIGLISAVYAAAAWKVSAKLGEMRAWWQRTRPKALAFAVHFLARLIGFTLRLEVRGENALLQHTKGKIVAGWHGRTFLAAVRWQRKGWWALISHSRDGEMQNRIFRRFGFRTVRGSTGKGGARAAVECARLLRQGECFVLTPDGPRGPSQKVQRGILWLAQRGDAVIFPAAASARPRKLFRSWDRYMLPAPFAKALILVGEPISVSSDAGETELAAIGEALEQQMNSLQEQADAEMGFS